MNYIFSIFMYKIVKKRCNSVYFVKKQDIWKLKCIKDGIFDYKTIK